MFSLSNKIVASVVLASFVLIALFSLVVMVHGSDGSMSGDCPLSAASTVFCPLNALDGAVHHISTYRSLFNIPLGYGILVLIISYFLILSGYFVIARSETTKQSMSIFRRLLRFARNDSISLYGKISTNWLSLLENSPSR